MEARRIHNLEKYGVEHPMQLESVREKHRESMMKMHGVESPLQSEEIKSRAYTTNIEKFGTYSALGNATIQQKIRETVLRKYGVEYFTETQEFKDKSRKTVMEKYGVECTAHIPGVCDKRRATSLRRYGVPNPMQFKAISIRASEARRKKNGAHWTPEMSEKAKKTFMEHYGVSNPSYSRKVIEKIANTMRSRYGDSHAVHLKEFFQKMKTTSTLKYGVPYYVVSKEYNESACHVRISNANRHFSELLNCAGIQNSFEYVVNTKSFDIIVPDQNTLIEIDPTYTHSGISKNHYHSALTKYYHRDKTLIAEQHGFRCIHVFDWDDPDFIVDMLRDKTILYARKCDLRRIDDKEASAFEADNHIQGSCSGQSICYGLYHDNQLVSVMTFGKPRYNKWYQYELLRLCTMRRYAIVGGAERMFKAFVREYNPESVISYCDIAKFSGDVYLKLGFKHIRNTAPNAVWSKKKEKITNNLLLARGFDQLFGTNYGKGTSNFNLMVEHGWLPVFDCGQGVYEYKPAGSN
jgi:hypothetical protein